MMDDNRYDIARKRVKAKMGFLTHLCVYVLVNGVLLVTHGFGSHGEVWSSLPLYGWGIGLLCHGLSVFFFSHLRSLERRMLHREMSRIEADDA